jgi:transcriptional repressor of cell division inhibition gene dicB
MTKDEAIAFYGNQSQLAQALDLTPSSVCEWGEYPPWGAQCELELLTKGKLRREPKQQKARQRAA